jgi:hypothetical protein
MDLFPTNKKTLLFSVQSYGHAKKRKKNAKNRKKSQKISKNRKKSQKTQKTQKKPTKRL